MTFNGNWVDLIILAICLFFIVGSRKSVKKMIQIFKKGPRHAKVEKVKVKLEKPDDGSNTFEILR